MYWPNVQGLRVKAFVVCGLLFGIEDTLKVHMFWRNAQGLRVKVFVVCCCVLVHELERQLKHKWAYILKIQTANRLFVCRRVCLFGSLLFVIC